MGRGQLVTARAVVAYGLLRFPVAVKARSMTRWNSLECDLVRYVSIRPSGDGNSGQVGTRRVTDGAVVVSLRWLVRASAEKNVVTQTVSLRFFGSVESRM